MEYRCSCGKRLRLPDNAAGKKARCPACGRVFELPAGGAAGAPARAAVPDGVAPAGGGRIVVTCRCGRRLSAPASAAGRQARCPACGEILSIPAPPPEPTEEELEIEEVAQGPTAPVPSDESYAIAASHCPNCGSEIQRGTIFCVECGTHLGSGRQIETEVERPVRPGALPRRRMGGARTWVGVVLLLLLLAGVAAAFTVFRGKLRLVVGRFTPGGASGKAGGSADTSRTGNSAEGYLENVVRAPGRVRETTSLLGMRQAIDSFRALKGRPPRSLDELKEEIPNLPDPPPGTEFVYDAATGRIETRRLTGGPR